MMGGLRATLPLLFAAGALPMGSIGAFLDVQLNSEGGYAVVVDGQTWLRSGELRLFVNGEWHATTGGAPPSPTPHKPPTCKLLNDTDMKGGQMLERIPNTTTAACCEACFANPSCDAFAWAAKADPPDAEALGANAHDCFLLGGVSGAGPSKAGHPRTFGWVRGSGHSVAPAPGKLTLQSTTAAASGSDRFGSFAKTVLHWKAKSSAGLELNVETAFRVYNGLSAGTVVFEQSIPTGATRTNYRNVSFADKGNTEILPFFHFPSFDTTASDSIWGGTRGNSAGFLTWQGTQISRGFLPLATGPPTSDMLGLDSGPVVLFTAASAHALVISPASHFKGAVQMRSGENWVAGVSGEVLQVPAGYSHETILHATAKGVTRTLDTWGGMMRRAFNTSKVVDPIVQTIGYWTDNGAYYYGDAYPQPRGGPDYNLSCCTRDKLLAARQGLLDDGIALQYLQLDDWWYHGPHPRQNFGGVKCVDRWELPADTYPGGLAGLSKAYGLPFLLYGPYFCEQNQWNQSLIPAGADAGVPPPEESLAFYSKVFDWLVTHGGNAYEVDFMNELYLGIPEFRRTLDAATVWQQGINQAGALKDVRTQFCMMQPSDLLNTLQFSHVTNGRASPDYASNSNWFIGGSSMLFWAVGMRPSKDNFWSSDDQPRQPGFREPNPGSNGELNAIIATMSTGPVGPADGAAQHNSTRLRRTCAANGRLLQTEKPLTPIDATFSAIFNGSGSTRRGVPAAAIWGSFSGGTGLKVSQFGQLVYHILAVDAEPRFSLLRRDLYQPISTSASSSGTAPMASDDEARGSLDDTAVAWPEEALLVRDWHRSSPCVDGADALESGCISRYVPASGNPDQLLHALDGGAGGPATPTGVVRKLQLLSITPVANGTSNGSAWVLLGELDKFVPAPYKNYIYDIYIQILHTNIAYALYGAGNCVILAVSRPRDW